MSTSCSYCPPKNPLQALLNDKKLLESDANIASAMHDKGDGRYFVRDNTWAPQKSDLLCPLDCMCLINVLAKFVSTFTETKFLSEFSNYLPLVALLFCSHIIGMETQLA